MRTLGTLMHIVVAALAGAVSFSSHAVQTQAYRYQSLLPEGHDYSTAWGVNNVGTVSGQSVVNERAIGWTWQDGQFSFVTGPYDDADVNVFDISDTGLVLGSYIRTVIDPVTLEPVTETASFIYDGVAYTILERDGERFSARGISPDGQWVSGTGTGHLAFAYNLITGEAVDALLTDDGDGFVIAQGINAAGVMVGSVGVGSSRHGFSMDIAAGGAVQYFDMPGITGTSARDITRDGIVAGFGTVTDPVTGARSTAGFVGTPSAIQVIAVPGQVATILEGINDAGWLVGEYRTSSGIYNEVAFVATPVPEPRTSLMVLFGAVVLLWHIRRRARTARVVADRTWRRWLARLVGSSVISLVAIPALADPGPVVAPSTFTSAASIVPAVFPPVIDQRTLPVGSSAFATTWSDGVTSAAVTGPGVQGCFGFCQGGAPGTESRMDFDAGRGTVKVNAIAAGIVGGSSVMVTVHDTIVWNSPLTFSITWDHLDIDAFGPESFAGLAVLGFVHDGSGYDYPLVGFGVTRSIEADGTEVIEGFQYEGESISPLTRVPASGLLSVTFSAPVNPMHVRWQFAASASSGIGEGFAEVDAHRTFYIGTSGDYTSLGNYGWINSPVPEAGTKMLFVVGAGLMLALRPRKGGLGEPVCLQT